jgi:hypothetical protein
MSEYCIVCAPRSGSYYFIKQFAKDNELVNGNEWFGRNKRVDHTLKSELKTETVDIDWNVNEDLLSDTEIRMRLNHLESFPFPYVIKCMPLQLTNTPKKWKLPVKKRLDIAEKILKDFTIIWFQQHDKVSHFCFEQTAMFCSMPEYPRKREFCTYNEEWRNTPESNTFTASVEQIYKYKEREEFTNKLMKRLKHKVVTYHEMDKCGVIPYPDYSGIFTNYEEIRKWLL